MATDVDGLTLGHKRFVAMVKSLREAEARVAELKREIADLEEPLIEAMAANGQQNVTIDGMTVYVRTTRYASRRKDKTTLDVQEALKACGWGDMIRENYNALTLQATINEMRDSEQPIPQQILDVLTIGDMQRLVAMKK